MFLQGIFVDFSPRLGVVWVIRVADESKTALG